MIDEPLHDLVGATLRRAVRSGVAEYCRDEAIRLLAYRPLGGERADLGRGVARIADADPSA